MSSMISDCSGVIKTGYEDSAGAEGIIFVSGYLFCGDCKNSMVRKAVPSGGRKYYYYVCSTNKHSRECTSHSVSEKKLTERVLHAVQDQVEVVCKMDEFLSYIDKLPEHQRTIFNYDAQIEQLQQENTEV